MATYLHLFNPLYKKVLRNIFISSVEQVRHATKKSGTSRPRKAAGGRSGRFGLKAKDGQHVKAGEVLANQPKLEYCPGLNVGVGKIAKLYAKTSGKFVITVEKPNFIEDCFLVTAKYPDRIPLYVEYLNVIPDPEPQKFKLVEKF